MECNKEEAIRAKELAEKKMQNKDFFGAKKFALKAKRLFDDLENISQILSVCEVHCCANSKINGEMDWYGILQVEQTADDSSIKKQYRKLALQLHPDKNKFPGAEAAFKLIGEANITLADQAKRSSYDMKRRCTVPKVVPRPQQQQSNMTTTRTVGQNTSTFGNLNPPPSRAQNQAPTFWTKCPNCFAKFQYYRVLLNVSLRCHNCLTNYVAFEIKIDVPNPNQNIGPRPNQNFGPRLYQNFGPRPNQNFGPGPSQNFGPRPNQNFSAQPNVNHNLKQEVPVQVNTRNGAGVSAKEQKARASTKKQKKRSRKRVVDSSESECFTDSEEEEEEEMDIDNLVNVDEQKVGASSSTRYPKRACRSSQNVKYNDRVNEDDIDYVSPKWTSKVEAEESAPNGVASNEKEEVQNVRSYSSPDSEFYDFEKERDPKIFEADQIWAVYDDQDAMPRFYVRIREVNHPFSLRFTWLEHNPQTELEQLYVNDGLPVGCGIYRLGTSDVTKDLQMFSHKISWSKGTRRNTFEVYPKKSEVWALFKGWDDKWPSNMNNNINFEYEVVEVISDCSDGYDFLVVHLVKVEGFVSLFVRSDRTFQIPCSKTLMFSHRVPAYRCSKNEKDGVQEGSFELDTASLPENFGNVLGSTHSDAASIKNDSSNQLSEGEKKCASLNTKSNSCDLLPNVFCDFANGRSIEKIKSGQMWALYSKVDKYPKYYAEIKKVDRDRNIITASSVELVSSTVDEAIWTEKGFPAARGRFRVDQKSVMFDSLKSFSHIVHATSVGKDEYVVCPQQGEVWALYRDWNVNWTKEDFAKCKYIVVEILECSFSAKVRILTRVDGYNFVFKPELKGGIVQDVVIPFQESLSFSHQIPAFLLTDQTVGALRGYWELDSASVPNL